jgi:hypothetical protein
MSRGKYFSLEEARKSGKLDRFAKEHPSEADRGRFNGLLDAMSRGALEAKETLSPGRRASSTGTRTRRCT